MYSETRTHRIANSIIIIRCIVCKVRAGSIIIIIIYSVCKKTRVERVTSRMIVKCYVLRDWNSYLILSKY